MQLDAAKCRWYGYLLGRQVLSWVNGSSANGAYFSTIEQLNQLYGMDN